MLRKTTACLLVMAYLMNVGCTNLPFPLPGVIEDLGRDVAMRQRGDVLTTSLDNAYSEFPLLDDWDPILTSGAQLQQQADGSFVFPPGVFELDVQSYCLGVGQYAPHRGGPGYLSAPLMGQHADIIRNILRNSANHPEIPQAKIQTLLWAIRSRTKVSDLSADMQQVARALLSNDEILRLNIDAQELMGLLIANLPSELRQAIEPVMQIQQLLKQGHDTFEQLERIAVRPGSPPAGADGHLVPYGRWSYHPKGFFIRYLPEGYSRTRIQISVPERFLIQRDGLGRIMSVADTHGNRIETEYDDTIAPLVLPEDPNLRGYAFRSIRFIRPKPSEPHQFEQIELKDVGWTFVSARKTTRSDGNRGAGVLMPLALLVRFQDEHVGGALQLTQGSPPDIDLRYVAWIERYHEDAKWLYYWGKHIERAGRKPGPEAIDEVLDLKHFGKGVKAAVTGSRSSQFKWLVEHFQLVARAYQYYGALIERLLHPDIPERGVSYEIEGDLGVPDNSGSQRLGLSTRSSHR